MGRLRIKSVNIGRIIFLVVLVCLISRSGYGAPWAGSGDANDPYQIWTAEDMQAIGADDQYWNSYFKLMTDIDLGGYTGTSFNIIGYYYNPFNYNPFTGVFDGGGYTISNFTYNSSGGYCVGIFGYIDEPNAEIKDLGLIAPDVNAGSGERVSSLVGYVEKGAISNCYVEDGQIKGEEEVGGLVGNNDGDIQNCCFAGTVTGNRFIGGLVGYNEGGEISDCNSTGTVACSEYCVGGLAGYNLNGAIRGSYSTGDVAGGDSAGGVVGYNNNSYISNCYSKCCVTGAIGVGGLVGGSGSSGEIEKSYSTGEIEGVDNVGGLIGSILDSCISASYSTGNVTGGDDRVGGLVGFNYDGVVQESYSTGSVSGDIDVGGLIGFNQYGEIQGCYSTGSVTGNYLTGGLVGRTSSGTTTSSFWDIQTSGKTTSAGGTGLSTVLMQTESTFISAGWDFVDESANGDLDIWRLCNELAEYPHLNWEYPSGDFGCPDGVNMLDFAVLGEAWFSDPNMGNWDAGCDISEPNDGVIDGRDLEVFVGNWLK